MKVGDLVRYHDGINCDDRVGLVAEIRNWVDKGAPRRNFGTDILVLWADGERATYSYAELRTIDEDW